MRIVLRVRQTPAWFRRLNFQDPAIAETSRPEMLRQLTNAALATPYYSQRQRADALLAASNLEAIPRTPLRDYLECTDQFTNPKIRKVQARFVPPLPTEGAAVAGTILEVPRNSSLIPAEALGRLHMSEARMLAATPSALRRICAAVEAQTLAMPDLDEAVVVLLSVGEGTLLPGERDMLWRCLGVPIFEQWIGLDGELLAWECEAHLGMHWNYGSGDLEESMGQLLVTSYKARKRPSLRLETGFTAEISETRCLCGRPGIRLINLRGAAAVEMAGCTIGVAAAS